MTSADSAQGGGRGPPKSRQKDQDQLISVCDKGGRGQKIKTFCGRHISITPDVLRAIWAGGQLVTQRRERGEALKIRDISPSLPNLHLQHKQKRLTRRGTGWPNWI